MHVDDFSSFIQIFDPLFPILNGSKDRDIRIPEALVAVIGRSIAEELYQFSNIVRIDVLDFNLVDGTSSGERSKHRVNAVVRAYGYSKCDLTNTQKQFVQLLTQRILFDRVKTLVEVKSIEDITFEVDYV